MDEAPKEERNEEIDCCFSRQIRPNLESLFLPQRKVVQVIHGIQRLLLYANPNSTIGPLIKRWRALRGVVRWLLIRQEGVGKAWLHAT